MYSQVCKDDGKTPHEALTGTKQDLSNLREFIFSSVIFLPSQRRTAGKFGPRGEEGIPVGYIARG